MPIMSFDANEAPAHAIEALRRDGGVIIRNAVSQGIAEAVKAELRREFDSFAEGERTDFIGKKTLRCGGVLRYAPTAAELIAHKWVTDIADAMLLPHCADYRHRDLARRKGTAVAPG